MPDTKLNSTNCTFWKCFIAEAKKKFKKAIPSEQSFKKKTRHVEHASLDGTKTDRKPWQLTEMVKVTISTPL